MRAIHARQINHDTVVTGREARYIVTSAADCQQDIVFGGELDRCHHIPDTRAPRYRGRPLIDHSIPDSPGCIVSGRFRCDQLSPKLCAQLLKSGHMSSRVSFTISRTIYCVYPVRF